MAEKIVAEGVYEPDKDDGGMSLWGDIIPEGSGETGAFFRVQSWDETKAHEQIRPFVGRRVRVTMEVVE